MEMGTRTDYQKNEFGFLDMIVSWGSSDYAVFQNYNYVIYMIDWKG